MKLYPYYDLWEPTQEEKRRYSLNLSKDFPATTIDIVLQTKDLYSNPVILRLFSSLFWGGQKGSFPYSSKDFVSKIQTYQIYTCDIPETFHLSYAYDIQSFTFFWHLIAWFSSTFIFISSHFGNSRSIEIVVARK